MRLYLGCMPDVTRILSNLEQGDTAAAELLLPLVYEELRRLAAARLAREKPGQTLQATALVHDAYLRLVDVKQAQHWNSRGHFFGAAAEAMRRIMIEKARRKKARELHNEQPIPIDRLELSMPIPGDDLLALNEALDRLEQRDSASAELVKLRFFAGLRCPRLPKRWGFRCEQPSGTGLTPAPGSTASSPRVTSATRADAEVFRKARFCWRYFAVSLALPF